MASPTVAAGKDVGEKLFLWREAYGWTQTLTAEKAGIDRSTVVLTETGETRPRLVTLRRLAKAFGVSVDELLSGPLPEEKTTT
ncbi:MAG: helix-turn-helix domain-containing protein [Actinomycetota bacterium]|nr:helix-turn-helix domain-containing protein [Actinomycetota bacterium]